MLGHPSSGVRTPRHDSEALVSGVVHGRPHELASDALSAEAPSSSSTKRLFGRSWCTALSVGVSVIGFSTETSCPTESRSTTPGGPAQRDGMTQSSAVYRSVRGGAARRAPGTNGPMLVGVKGPRRSGIVASYGAIHASFRLLLTMSSRA